jgi:D-sedoheptulose 7-phosphate isomerase
MLSHEQQVTVVAPSTQDALSPTEIYHNTVIDALACRRAALDTALDQMMSSADTLARVANQLIETLLNGNKVLVAGNGGSAAEAQHFAAEFVGRFKRERKPYAVLSLTTDTSILTAVSNDYGFEDVFSRQVRAFGQPGDLFFAFSTSGESENLLQAATAARKAMMQVIAVTGVHHSTLEELSDLTVRVPVGDTALAQELHTILTHTLCDIAETQLSSKGERL